MALHQGSRRPNASALLCVTIACAIVLGCSNGVFAKDGDKNGDDDDGDAKTNSVWPTTYLDMRTAYATVPAGSLPIGFGNTALGSALESLALSTGNGLPMDDNDNRLFGVTAEIMWVPKPAYLLTLRTPLYLVRN